MVNVIHVHNRWEVGKLGWKENESKERVEPSLECKRKGTINNYIMPTVDQQHCTVQ